MAHGFECADCGYQESEHQGVTERAGACPRYVSPCPKEEKEMWSAIRENRDWQDTMKRRGPAYET